MRERRRVGTGRGVATVLAAGALLVAACGSEDPDGVAVASAEQEPDAPSEEVVETEEETEPAEDPTPEPGDDDVAASEAPSEDEEEDAAPTEEDAAEDAAAGVAGDQGDPGAGEAGLGACDLAGAEAGTPLDVDAYEQATLEANFELELLVTDMAADLDELLSGVSDGPTLEAQLAEHRAAYAQAVEPLRGVAPPDGAAQWHERAMASFDDVCTAIEDGLAGSAEGDDARFEEFVTALTEFPGLINGLHANAACGPFESC